MTQHSIAGAASGSAVQVIKVDRDIDRVAQRLIRAPVEHLLQAVPGLPLD